MGALASGKFVVRASYLLESARAGAFIKERDFIPNFCQNTLKHVWANGKLFQNQTAMVLIDNARRQAEFKVILRDAGATIRNWSLTYLGIKPKDETLKLDVIYTNLSCLNSSHYQKFVTLRKSEKRPVVVLSYYFIFKFINSHELHMSASIRQSFEKQFDINNDELMSRLHPDTNIKKVTNVNSVRTTLTTTYLYCLYYQRVTLYCMSCVLCY